MLAADVRDVEALDADRQALHPQSVLERGHGVDPRLPTALAAQAVLGERQPRVPLRELAQAAQVAALGNTHFDRSAPLCRERLGQQGRPVADRGPGHDQPRHRGRRGVVLGDELLGDLRLVALPAVRHVEALALGEDPVADLEDLGVRGLLLGRDGDHVRVLERLAGDAAFLHQGAHRVEPVAIDGGALELLGRGGLVHLALEVALDVPVAAGEEPGDRVDVPPVLLAVDVSDAGRLAPLDVVVEARDARAAARLRPVAGSVLEELAEQLQGLARALGVRVRAEVEPRRAVPLAREIHARELLVQADADVRVRLVVAQPDVEARAVALDELLLGEQRVRLGLGHEELDRSDLLGHRPRAGLAREVPADPLADRARLADVEDFAVAVAEQCRRRARPEATAAARRRSGPRRAPAPR